MGASQLKLISPTISKKSLRYLADNVNQEFIVREFETIRRGQAARREH